MLSLSHPKPPAMGVSGPVAAVAVFLHHLILKFGSSGLPNLPRVMSASGFGLCYG